MGEVAIRVEGLGKEYKIGRTLKRHDTLRDRIAEFRLPALGAGKRANGHSPQVGEGNPPASDRIWALKDVSFEVKRGEVVGIIGRNGAGKSTLLKILSRITEPTAGAVDLYGRVGSLLEVGTGFHPELTGRENIFLNGAILGMHRAEIAKKFDEIVAFAEVEKFIDTPVKRYSSGMYVRLAFAVAAHLEPEILLVDEVLAVGDAAFQKKCLGKMGDVAREGRTVLFVSHNMAAISGMCDKVMVIEKGEIVLSGNPRVATQKYLSLFSPSDNSRIAIDTRARNGEGPVRFTTFHCEVNGEPVDQLISGSRTDFVIGYESSTDRVENVGVSLVIYSGDGVRLSNLWNEYENGEPFTQIPGRGSFICSFEKLPFRTGSYIVSVFCSVDDRISDWVQQAVRFDVTDGDYYGSGRISRNENGYVFLDHRWDLRGTQYGAT